jgi:hypothetical protein
MRGMLSAAGETAGRSCPGSGGRPAGPGASGRHRHRRHSGQGEAGVHAGEYEDAHESPASSVDLPPGRRLGVPTLARVQQPRDTEKDLELPAPPPWYRRRLLFGQGQVPLRRGAAPAGGPTAGRRPRPQHAGHLPGRPSGRLRRRRPAVTHTLCSAAATPLPKRPPGASTGHCSGQGNPPAGQAGAKPAPSHRRFRPRMLAVHRTVRRRRPPIPARPLPKHVQPHPGEPERKKR